MNMEASYQFMMCLSCGCWKLTAYSSLLFSSLICGYLQYHMNIEFLCYFCILLFWCDLLDKGMLQSIICCRHPYDLVPLHLPVIWIHVFKCCIQPHPSGWRDKWGSCVTLIMFVNFLPNKISSSSRVRSRFYWSQRRSFFLCNVYWES